MSGHEKVLWKRPDHPDSYIPPDSFLSSLRKNRKLKASLRRVQFDTQTANFHPYTYWELVPLSFAVTQHLATIFVFLSAFVHLKEGTLDPRTLVWITSVCFVLGYLVWEIQDYTSGSSALWRVDRSFAFKSFCKRPSKSHIFLRRQTPQVVHPDIPISDVIVSGTQDSDCCDIFGLDLGIVGVSIHSPRPVSGLWLHHTLCTRSRKVSDWFNAGLIVCC